MSNKLINKSWSIQLVPSSKLILICLADMASDKNKNMCWPSIQHIMNRTGLSERTVQTHIKKLEEAGHITRILRDGMSTKYFVHPRSDCTPVANTEVQSVISTPAIYSANPSSECTQTLITQNLKPDSNQNKSIKLNNARSQLSSISIGSIANKQLERFSNMITDG